MTNQIERYRKVCMGPPITRRSVLICGTSAAALAGGLPLLSGAEETVTLDQFRTLAARLTGAAVSDLDEGMASKLLGAFLAMGRGPALAALAADPASNTGPVANEIVAAWYSGTYKTPPGLAVAGFTDALLWKALDFTKPLGECGGETGYWANPP